MFCEIQIWGENEEMKVADTFTVDSTEAKAAVKLF